MLVLSLSVNTVYAITATDLNLLARMAYYEAPALDENQIVEAVQVVLRRQKDWTPKIRHYGAKSNSITALLKSKEFSSRHSIFHGKPDEKRLVAIKRILRLTQLKPSVYSYFCGHNKLKFRKSFTVARK